MLSIFNFSFFLLVPLKNIRLYKVIIIIVMYCWVYNTYKCALVFCGCCDKLLYTGLLKTVSLLDLDRRNQNSWCWQGCTPFRGSMENLFLAFSTFWWLLTSLQSLSPSSHGLFLCVCFLIFYLLFKNKTNFSLELAPTWKF